MSLSFFSRNALTLLQICNAFISTSKYSLKDFKVFGTSFIKYVLSSEYPLSSFLNFLFCTFLAVTIFPSISNTPSTDTSISFTGFPSIIRLTDGLLCNSASVSNISHVYAFISVDFPTPFLAETIVLSKNLKVWSCVFMKLVTLISNNFIVFSIFNPPL